MGPLRGCSVSASAGPKAAANPLPRPSDEEMDRLVEKRDMELIFEGAMALGPNRKR